MRHFSSLGKPLTGAVLVAIPLLFPVAAKAQINLNFGTLFFAVCMAQNWNTPTMQSRLKEIPRQERIKLYGSLEFSSEQKRCLMQKKAVPVALCDKVVAQFAGFQKNNVVDSAVPPPALTSEEENTLFKVIENNRCRLDDDSHAAQDWLPEDLKPSAVNLELLACAKKGEKAAQLEAVALYTNGKDVPPNVERADYWLSQAAINGDANSQLRLGWKYWEGKEPHRINFKQAIHFLTLAANQGNRDAMASLAQIYREDEPDYGETKQRKNMAQAMGWFIKAANLGDPDAATALARIHETGDQVPVDDAKAFSWYQKSAENLSATSMLKLSELYQAGKGTAKNVETAQQWRRKADALNVNGTTLYLVQYFPWGEMPHGAADVARIQLAHATAGDVDAQLAIARRYFDGEGVKKDGMIATMWWRKAAMAGDAIGQRMLGKSLMYGWDPAKTESDDAGLPWIEKAASQGDTEAQVVLAYRNADGGAARNSEERKRNVLDAVRLMRQAAERGYNPEDTRERADKWMDAISRQ